MGRIDGMEDENGIEYLFYSSDHLSQHFHAIDKGGEWNIRVFFLSCSAGQLSYEYKFPPPTEPDSHPLPIGKQQEILRKMKLLEHLDGAGKVVSYKEVLLRQWNSKVAVKDKHEKQEPRRAVKSKRQKKEDKDRKRKGRRK